ncbi:putative membrane spanning protein [Roseomonas mucosa]|uniref:Glycerol-3-phosphate acyltransferase n=1 Tax=Roseomonas mucosa TaxID=207340 RepID=A0A1S8D761_9PROT|nr:MULTISPECIES: glycerol-3-phosphate 1-O-acyltransferase PlsY [Roseomonas]MBS5901081.1 glycerol-3-phosphate 1-O-acyltransferase PlsY [Acetobacteraceae bacterium]ATR20520.1 acyl-phosphate glycerol 3-phosphate acyltransferase [Roseomonas sp. FDAARGOS_362]AWV23260.1 putative membrane spanning protein [Roseomonas mucosa]MCG7353533.1 glycerol-3-phosphate 1-O-acyltransferase PlsY [Roseomonas mucosa]MCG7358935.1 glycerol-3-phosphate 1-O-acyltransferase PlsY [Roseomonas mucosa]
MSPWTLHLLGLLIGLLLGSIPFGLILTRAAGLGDIRSIGSGNIGATNVLRTGNRKLAAATLLLDALKGTAAVLLAAALLGPGAAPAAAVGAVLGHCHPPWLGFRGGKGVATSLGVFLALSIWVFLAAALGWLAVAKVTRISSAGALGGLAIALLAAWALEVPAVAIAVTLIVLYVYVRHHENIRRLLAGTEPRIGQGKEKPGA